MAKSAKRAWKLQEFPSNAGAVNCLSIGHKSGKVLATGGEDKKVNLFAIGKTNCILSLKGHSTSVESLRFNGTENLVAAGSQGGVLKIWDLEASKVLRTLSGHKCNVRSLDFHPFGEIIASGSMDTNIKLWDFRRKGCIFTYKGHSSTINNLRFSPDGKWIASASDDNTARLWDMSTGRQIAEFPHNFSSVNTVEFHPIDFLLVTGGSDKTVKFWDLETLKMVDTTDADCGPIRTVFVHPEGTCVYASCQDYLKVYGWEPTVCFDTVSVAWGRPADIVVHQNELVGASFHQSNVSIFIADLQKIQPFCLDQDHLASNSSPFNKNASRRRSFITKSSNNDSANKNGSTNDFSIETPVRNSNNDNDINDDDATDDNDEEEEEENANAKYVAASSLNISSLDYDQVFNPKRELPRDVPQPSSASSTHDSKTTPNFRVNANSQSATSPVNKILFTQKNIESDQVKQTNAFVQQQHNFLKQNHQFIQKQSTQTSSNDNTNMTTNTSSTSTAPNTKPLRRPINCRPRDSPRTTRVGTNFRTVATTSVVAASTAPVNATATSLPTAISTATKQDDGADNPATRYFRLAPSSDDKKNYSKRVEDDFKISDFSPKISPDDFPMKPPPNFLPNLVTNNLDNPGKSNIIEDFLPKQFSESISDEKAMNIVGGGHQAVLSVLSSRNRSLQVFKTLRSGGNIKMALDSVTSMNDQAVLQDVISLLLQNPVEWTLDTCASVLPIINSLIGGRYELYTVTGLKATNFILRTFASLIKDTISNVSSIGIDISREERYNKSLKCYNLLMGIGTELDKRAAPFRTPAQNDQIREIKLLLSQLD